MLASKGIQPCCGSAGGAGALGSRGGLSGIPEVTHGLPRCALHELLFLKVFFLPKEPVADGQHGSGLCPALHPCSFCTHCGLPLSSGALSGALLPAARDQTPFPKEGALSLPMDPEDP